MSVIGNIYENPELIMNAEKKEVSERNQMAEEQSRPVDDHEN
jgi:hypothetical protein